MSKVRCDQCGQRIGAEAIIPSEAWERIARGAYALCPPCIDARLVEVGIECRGLLFFRGKALRTPEPDELEVAMRAFRPSQMQVERDGNVGVESLRADAEVWAAMGNSALEL